MSLNLKKCKELYTFIYSTATSRIFSHWWETFSHTTEQHKLCARLWVRPSSPHAQRAGDFPGKRAPGGVFFSSCEAIWWPGAGKRGDEYLICLQIRGVNFSACGWVLRTWKKGMLSWFDQAKTKGICWKTFFLQVGCKNVNSYS
jgi:hypothetical protein